MNAIATLRFFIPRALAVRLLASRTVVESIPFALKVLVAGDQAMVRDMLVHACREVLPGARIASTRWEDGLGAVAVQRPDLLLLDFPSADDRAFSSLGLWVTSARPAKLVALVAVEDEYSVERLLDAPVDALLDKREESLGVLGNALAEALAGRQYLAPAARRMRARLRADPVAFNKLLSVREQQLLTLFGQGLSNAEVAALHGRSVHTVKIHRRNIMGKLGLHSTPQLIRYAVEKGFASLKPSAGYRRTA